MLILKSKDGKVLDTSTGVERNLSLSEMLNTKIYGVHDIRFGDFSYLDDVLFFPISDELWHFLDYIEDSERTRDLPRHSTVRIIADRNIAVEKCDGYMLIQPTDYYAVDPFSTIYVSHFMNKSSAISLLDIFLEVAKSGVDFSNCSTVYINTIYTYRGLIKFKIKSTMNRYLTKLITLK